MNTLISISELSSRLDQPDVLIFDCRHSLLNPDAGRLAYEASHIPGAHHADMNRQLSAPHIPGSTGRHPLPARDDWLQQVQTWGIGPATQVMAYDDVGGAAAARLWWMLRWAGHELVAVLDGGWQAWTAAGLPVTPAIPVPPVPGSWRYGSESDLVTVIQAADVNGTRQLLLDARELPRFRGEAEPIDPVAGHIPGAVCSPHSANLTPAGTFRTPAQLREKFAISSEAGKPVVCYCGSGVTACHNILAMTIAGLPMPALYAGSWSEWITDPARPIATGD